MKSAIRFLAVIAAVATGFVGCGKSRSDDPPPPPPAPTFTVSATISGLVGSGLSLSINGGDFTPVATNGSVTFATAVAAGSTYEVTVESIPSNPVQRCTVTNGFGTMSNAAVTNVAVACVTRVPRFAYSANYNGGSLSIFNVDAATGQLRMRGYAKTGQTPLFGVGTSDGAYAYMLATGAPHTTTSLPPQPATSASITAYRHDEVTGQQVEIGGSPYLLGVTLGTQSRLSMHPNNRFLYVTGDTNGTMWIFSINASTGALTPIGSPSVVGGIPAYVTFNAQGTMAYVSNRTLNEITTYNVNTNTGVLTEALPRIPIGGSPSAVALHPNGRFAYTLNTGSDSVSVFAVSATTGLLTSVPGSPFAVSAGAVVDSFGFHPNGRFAFARSVGQTGMPGAISVFTINRNTGALAPLTGSPFPIGANAAGMSLHPTGRFLYVINRATTGTNSNGSIAAYSFDSSTGVPAELSTLTLAPAPFSVSVDPSGNFLYSASVDGDLTYSYRINQTTGELTALPRAAIMRSGAQPISLIAYPAVNSSTAPVFRSKFAYVPNGDGTISNYAIDATTGALTNVGNTTAGAAPQVVTLSQGSSFAFAANAGGSNTLSPYSINPTTGALTLVPGTIATGTAPSSAAADPSGRFVYVTNATSNTISAYAINRATGALTAIGSPISPNLGSVIASKVDPTGRNLYALTPTATLTYAINPNTGALTQPLVGPYANTLPGNCQQFAVDPNGRFLYVLTSANGGSIYIFSINAYHGTLGILNFGSPHATSRVNTSLAIDPSGRFAYTADNTSAMIVRYSITQGSGALAGTFGGAVASTTAAANVRHVSVDYSGRILYAVLADATVAAYAIDQTTGNLSFVVGGGAATGASPGPITVVGEVE